MYAWAIVNEVRFQKTNESSMYKVLISLYNLLIYISIV